MTKIVDDPFTEGSTTELDAHTPNTAGDGWTEEENTTSPDRPMFVQGGLGHASVTAGDAGARLVYSAQPDPSASATTEYDVGLVFAALPPSFDDTVQGLIARFVDVNNLYFSSVDANTIPPNGLLEIHKKVTSTVTEIASSFDLEVVAGDEMIFKIRNDTDRQVWRNETQSEEVTADDTALTAAGKCGLHQGNLSDSSNDTDPAWDLDEFYWDDLNGGAPVEPFPVHDIGLRVIPGRARAY